MKQVVRLVQLFEDLKGACYVINTFSKVYCEVFEDNQSCVAVAESKKPLTRTKHITIKYHHFRSLLDKKVIRIKYIDTKQ